MLSSSKLMLMKMKKPPKLVELIACQLSNSIKMDKKLMKCKVPISTNSKKPLLNINDFIIFLNNNKFHNYVVFKCDLLYNLLLSRIYKYNYKLYLA